MTLYYYHRTWSWYRAGRCDYHCARYYYRACLNHVDRTCMVVSVNVVMNYHRTWSWVRSVTWSCANC
jgi:hypothetical protein